MRDAKQKEDRRDSGFDFLPLRDPPSDTKALNLHEKHKRKASSNKVPVSRKKRQENNPFNYEPPSDGIPANLPDFEPSSGSSSPGSGDNVSPHRPLVHANTRRNAREQPLTEWDILSASGLEPRLRADALQLVHATQASRKSGHPNTALEAQLANASTVLRLHLTRPESERPGIDAVKDACGFHDGNTKGKEESCNDWNAAGASDPHDKDSDSNSTLTSMSSTKSNPGSDSSVDKQPERRHSPRGRKDQGRRTNRDGDGGSEGSSSDGPHKSTDCGKDFRECSTSDSDGSSGVDSDSNDGKLLPESSLKKMRAELIGLKQELAFCS